MEDKVIRTLRCMAWERAKGELQAILNTFWGKDKEESENYCKASEVINEFIFKVEDEGLIE